MNELSIDLQVACETNHPAFEKIHYWVSEALKTEIDEEEKEDIEVCIRIVDKEESQQLNNTYRKKNKPTNVLSFYYSDDDWDTEDIHLLGDLVICAEIVEEEAKEQNKPIEAHWAHLIIHGILHLLEYDHQSDEDAKKMEGLEVEILKKLGYKNPYQE
jgi:probable rRNA maturation factor